MMDKPKLLLASKNLGKLREIKNKLDNSFEILSLADFPQIEEIEECGSSFYQNAVLKARYYSMKTGLLTLGEDSGLVIDALNGQPGIYSSRFMGSETPPQEKNLAILEMLKGVSGDKRQARFVCCMALLEPPSKIYSVTGRVEGLIAYQPAGESGFGYDPIFFLPELSCTMAQLPLEKKNEISHRAKALDQLILFLEKSKLK